MNSYDYASYDSSPTSFDSSSSSFWTGMMWGIAIGAMAALFLTPRRGAELRGVMADSMNRASRRAKDTYNLASETMSDLAGRAADVAQSLSNHAATLTAKLNKDMSARISPPSMS